MKLYRIIIIFIAVFFLFGCAGSSKKMNQLKLGMTMQEVIDAIGEPASK
jgi:outer membrane protein assembly factor BamE (lipoprotein component of BamABCDE complex)